MSYFARISAFPQQDAVSEAVPKAIAASVEAMLPEILADDCEPLAQTSDMINGEAEQDKLAYFVQALEEAQAEISRLKDERDSLDAECQTLHARNGDLNNEIAHLKSELIALKQQFCNLTTNLVNQKTIFLVLWFTR